MTSTSPLVRSMVGVALALGACTAFAQVTVLTEVEPNNKRNNAQLVPVDDLVSVVAGNLSKPKDVDLYKINLPIGACVATVLTPNPLADYDLYLMNNLGLVLAKSENRGFAKIETLATCGLPLSQTYYLRVVYHSGPTGRLTGTYGVEIAPVQP